MQEVDAERRIQLLRGLPAPSSFGLPENPRADSKESEIPKRVRKRRRIAGEDDTARDIRFAQEDQTSNSTKAELSHKPKKSSDAPLIDSRGHIDLFPVEGSRHNAPKNAEAEAEKARKNKEYEDQYTMRFSNAAGFKQSVGQKPWYQSLDPDQGVANDESFKNVWGNEDPRRKEREKARVAADDPMALMKKGVSQLREAEKENKQWQAEREQELRELAEMQSKEQKRKSRRKRPSQDSSLEGFSLDAPAENREQREGNRHRQRHRHGHRSTSREHKSHHPHRHRHHRHDEKALRKQGLESRSQGRYSSQFAHVTL